MIFLLSLEFGAYARKALSIAGLLFAFNPASIFFSAVYSESLHFACALTALLLLRTENVTQGGERLRSACMLPILLLLFCAAATRSTARPVFPACEEEGCGGRNLIFQNAAELHQQVSWVDP